ncbi:biotin--[acetyl-CoA-carboxylase] ligase [Thalassospira marina]|uniref:biotin--[biotin carboxyl-carrier protein] ligase n=1 Tax=Thalassospira marina TaxID=2048283 RepID=A0ABM6Q9C2_9PROT|nr:biotin--[acetyl-CoA-carboxylase] ligase [Thalassospira marina]AUG53055.1 biotin--[acetyl-CoA-carboxylase] ligase [Thalassospira marina]
MTDPVVRLPDGYVLHFHEVIDSTNEEAKRLGDKGAPGGALILAARQLAGRGRRGREWKSPTGNLFLSLLLRPNCPLQESARLTFLAALAMAEAVDIVSNGEITPECKWPNDLMVGGRKLCGILLESASSHGRDTDYLVIGTGVNIAFHPDDVERPSTSFAALGVMIRIEDLVSAYISRFDDLYSAWQQDGFNAIRQAWLDRAYGFGQPIVARLSERTLTGTFVGLDQGGSLILKDDRGVDHVIGAGEVFFKS